MSIHTPPRRASPSEALVEYNDAVTAFRDEVRQWLAQNAPHELRGARVGYGDVSEYAAALRRWEGVILEGGFMCVSWPIEYGGRGLSEVEVSFLAEEFECPMV